LSDGARRLAGRAASTTAVALALAFSPACAEVLDLDDLRDPIAELCKCDSGESPVPKFGGDCEAELEDRLGRAAAQTREQWLTFYADNCDEGCSAAFECFQQDPTCSHGDCGEDRECCGHAVGNRCSSDGVCVDADGNPIN